MRVASGEERPDLKPGQRAPEADPVEIQGDPKTPAELRETIDAMRNIIARGMEEMESANRYLRKLEAELVQAEAKTVKSKGTGWGMP